MGEADVAVDRCPDSFVIGTPMGEKVDLLLEVRLHHPAGTPCKTVDAAHS